MVYQPRFLDDFVKMNYFKLCFIFLIPGILSAEVPVGNYDSITVSEISGDQGGYEIEISKGGKKGFFAEYMGERQPEIPLKNIVCIEKENICKFSLKRKGEKAKEGTLLSISKTQAILMIPDEKLKKLVFKQNSNS
jgi:hypothetical protein